jgi:hypothetical protein
VALAMRAADDARLPADPEFRAALAGYLEWASRAAQAESADKAGVPADEPVPRWDWSPIGPPTGGGLAGGAETAGTAGTADADQPAVALPGPDEAVSFEAHVKPLFRAKDRQSMLFAFDLWTLADAQAHAADILDRLRAGTMPCDGAWPPEKVDVFQRWTESGFQP